MRSGFVVCPVVTAHATLAPIVAPLDTEPSAVEFIVIVVHRVCEPKPPHGISGGRVIQEPMRFHRGESC